MRRLLLGSTVALGFFAALAVVAIPLQAATPARVAVNRCNSQTVDDAYARVRDFDRHPPGGSSSQLLQRIGAITAVLATLQEEREILDSMCGSDAARAPLFAQIAATTAWALILESDVAARLNAACPAAVAAFPKMMLSDAWLSLANVVNDAGGSVPPVFADVIPKIQSRAQAVALALPSWPDTSAYWRDQIHKQAKAAVATCPSPSPTPAAP